MWPKPSQSPSLGYPGETRSILKLNLGTFEKCAMMLAIGREAAGHPEIREYTYTVLRRAGAPAKQPLDQIDAVLEDLQGMYYLGEKEETFQRPEYTIAKRF